MTALVYSANFIKAKTFTLEREGVFSNVASDPGGATVYGIARAFHPAIPWPPTKEQAIDIYYTEYWLPLRCDDLPYPFALVTFECSINQGVDTSIRCMQSAVGAQVDGQYGNKTAALVKASRSNPEVLALFMAFRVQHYVAIKASNPPNYEDSNKGWYKRMFLSMLAGVEA